MFAKLSGMIDDITLTHVIMDVQGVGYLVAVSARTRGRLERGASARLLIETQVREDAINLHGFIDAEEQAWFRLLTGVQGVGPRVGLAILSVCSPEQLPMIIASNDPVFLRKADGVGPKLATRICVELKDKVQGMSFGGAQMFSQKSVSDSSKSKQNLGQEKSLFDSDIDQEVVSALINLGYGRVEAFLAVAQARRKCNENNIKIIFESLLKLTLKSLSS